MISCKLGENNYIVDFVPGRALREIEPALRMWQALNRIATADEKGEALSDEDKKITVPMALDVMVRWFCILFGNQFKPDDVYDNYPADCLVKDISVALMAVNGQVSEALSAFPMKPAAKRKTKS